MSVRILLRVSPRQLPGVDGRRACPIRAGGPRASQNQGRSRMPHRTREGGVSLRAQAGSSRYGAAEGRSLSVIRAPDPLPAKPEARQLHAIGVAH